ncbi:MAG TPA: TonB-dependent receptor, partial [Sphingobacteriaceae bacterium]
LGPQANIYASYAVGNKEPNRDDYINSMAATPPRPETLQNLEAGYRLNTKTFRGGINGFAMLYRDQLILTGKINDVGEYIRQNVPDSYRIGLEMDARIQLARNLVWSPTLSLSENKIRSFTEYVDDYDNGGQIVNQYSYTDIAFSPAVVASSELAYVPARKIELALLSRYAGSQYLDNTSSKSRRIDPFFVSDLRLRYNTSLARVKNIGVTLLINNVFSERYEANGYTFSYRYDGTLTTENFYFPQATRNFMLGVNLKF